MDVRWTVACLTAIAMVVGGCESTVAGRGVAAVGSVEWGPCRPLPLTAIPPAAQCGKVSVPLDYSDPDGAQATIAVARLPATGARDDRIGSVLMNFGGPGVTGIDALFDWIGYYPDDLRERFDLVAFDPRGIGQSRPAVRCNTDAENDADRAEPGTVITGIGSNIEDTPEEAAAEDRATREFVRRCMARTDPKLLANVGTIAVAKDLDRIREAVGDDKLTYVGFSYGTLLGAQYAELFTDRVRALVLDGAVDPAVDGLQVIVDQAAATQKAFDEYAADCARTVPDCPVGTDPAKAVDTLHALIDPLAERPAPTADPRGLGYNDALTAVWNSMYSTADWAGLTTGLRALRDGQHVDDLLASADLFNGRNAEGRYDNSNDALHVVLCADLEYPQDAAAYVELDKKLREVAPLIRSGPHTGHVARDVCAFWPVPADDTHGAVSAPGLPRVLVISTTGDPATPYLDGVHLAEQLDAALLAVEGTQHTAAFYGVACIDDIVNEYLVDLRLPPDGARCTIG